jgi:aspartate aminotransferase, cytoplasmic
MGSAPASAFARAEFIPPDAIFEVTKRYLADADPKKVNLGQGTYRDENGNPWILPSVCKAKVELGEGLHEYLPIAGLQQFRDEAVKVAFEGSKALSEKRVRV